MKSELLRGRWKDITATCIEDCVYLVEYVGLCRWQFDIWFCKVFMSGILAEVIRIVLVLNPLSGELEGGSRFD